MSKKNSLHMRSKKLKYKLYRKYYGVSMSAYLLIRSNRADSFTAKMLNFFELYIMRKYRVRRFLKIRNQIIKNIKIRGKNFKYNVVGKKYLAVKEKLNFYNNYLHFKNINNVARYKSSALTIKNATRASITFRARSRAVRNFYFSDTFKSDVLDRGMYIQWVDTADDDEILAMDEELDQIRTTPRALHEMPLWMDFTMPVKRKKKPRWILKKLFERQLANYYGFFHIRQFRLFQQIITKKNRIWLSLSLKFETMISLLFFKANFFKTKYLIREIIKRGGAMVNGRVVFNPYFSLKLGDILHATTVEDDFLSLFELFIENLSTAPIITNHPKYLEVSYKLMAISVWRPPYRNEVFSNFNPLSGRTTLGFNTIGKHAPSVLIK